MKEGSSSFRTSAGPAVIAALALAIISVAATASPAAGPAARPCDARAPFAEADATRLLAAAVIAAKNLLGVDGATAIIPALPVLLCKESAAAPLMIEDAQTMRPRGIALEAHLIDLPPPAC